MVSNKYLLFRNGHILIYIRSHLDEGVDTFTKKILVSKYDSFIQAVEAARKERDELFLKARGIPFDPTINDVHTRASKTSKTGIAGVSPYVSVKLGAKRPYIAVGYSSSALLKKGRVRETHIFEYDNKSSELAAFRDAVKQAYELRHLEIPTDKEIKEMLPSISWDEIINEKMEKAIKKAEEKSAQQQGKAQSNNG